MYAKLIALAEKKAKAIGAGLGTAVATYAVSAVEEGKPLSLAGAIAAIVASPVVAGYVHQIENAPAE